MVCLSSYSKTTASSHPKEGIECHPISSTSMLSSTQPPASRSPYLARSTAYSIPPASNGMYLSPLRVVTPSDSQKRRSHEALILSLPTVAMAPRWKWLRACAGAMSPMVILPGGTANLLSVELGIPKELAQAAQLAIDENSTTLPVDMGRVVVGETPNTSLSCAWVSDSKARKLRKQIAR